MIAAKSVVDPVVQITHAKALVAHKAMAGKETPIAIDAHVAFTRTARSRAMRTQMNFSQRCMKVGERIFLPFEQLRQRLCATFDHLLRKNMQFINAEFKLRVGRG